ncbi:hypothetical protein Q8A73_007472 [Channa argus]|nr:hypothetical protein Q8A73_007472 [Channa argus]
MASARDGAGRRRRRVDDGGRGAARSTSAGNNGDDNKTGGKPVRGKLNGWSHHEDRAVQPPPAQLVSISRAARFSALESGPRSDSQQLAVGAGDEKAGAGALAQMTVEAHLHPRRVYVANLHTERSEMRVPDAAGSVEGGVSFRASGSWKQERSHIGQKPLPVLTSLLAHTSRRLAASLLLLRSLWQQERHRQATYGTKTHLF